MRISDWSSDVCSSDLRSAAWLAPPDVRRRHRQEQARPQIDALRGAIDDALRRLSPKSAMAKALAYGRKRWDALTRYLDEGTAEIDNNIAERAIRSIAIGRKNWLFAGSDRKSTRLNSSH